jgi:metal-sulfur cluster biosynthetic enzyme
MSSREIDADAVRDRLRSVDDPELDRSIVELEYVDEIRIDGGSVEVAFTLPTAWCSPAFAWMMAADARDAVADHPAVSGVTVRLCDHMHAAEINEGVNAGLPFERAFEEADDDIREVRRTLDGKARLARQYRAISALLENGLEAEQIVRLTREDVDLDVSGDRAAVRVNDALSVCVDSEPIRRHLEKATAMGLLTSATDELFATPDGDPIPVERFETVHRRGRLAETNMSSQAHVCEKLGEARIGGPSDD